MAARTLLRAIGALGLAMLVATSTLMSVAASIPDRHDHGDAASAIGGQDLVGLAGTVGQAEPPSHCHPEIDCALTAMFLHDDMALPSPAALSRAAAPADHRLRSISLSSQPPPPRTTSARDGKSMQT